MAKLIKGIAKNQLALFECRIDEMIDIDNEVRVIEEYIENMDITKLGFTKAQANEEGTNHYDDKDLLKLYIYGYRHKVRSSRKLEEQCRINIEVIWLIGGIRPNFRTISDFRKNHAKDIKKVFQNLVMLCKELGMVGEIQSQDGVKIRAVNAKERNYTLNKLDERIERITKSVTKYLRELDRIDKMETEEEEQRKRIEENKKEIEELIKEKERQAKELATIRQEIEKAKESQKSLTDEESRLMKNNGHFDVCYNNQVVVDMKSHIVTNYKADNNPADVGTMKDIMEELKEMLGIEVMKDVTDQGYKDTKDMRECLLRGIIPEVTPGKEEEGYKIEMERAEEKEEITEEERKSRKKEDIEKCLRNGIIPEVYEEYLREIKEEEKIKYETEEEMEGNGDKLEEYEKRNYAMEKKCFVRDKETNKVYCPMGETLREKSKNKEGKKYCNKRACENCKAPCTKAKYKELVMQEGQVVSGSKEAKEGMNPKQKKRRKKIKLITVIMKPKKEEIKKRMQTSEHVHGTMKRADGMDHFLLKGKEKVNGELGLYYIGSNIRRMVNIMGVKELIRRMREIRGMQIA